MLAVAAEYGTLPKGRWVAEEKHDGWRIITAVAADGTVRMWTRTGKSFPVLKQFVAPLQHLRPESGLVILDGEAKIPGGVSTDMADLAKRHRAVYIVFDLLQRGEEDTTSEPWYMRRAKLEVAMAPVVEDRAWVQLASAVTVQTWEQVEALADIVWQNTNGEGLILKNADAKYEVGKRRKSFLKIKEVQPAVLKIIGFAPSEGEIMHYGDYGTAVLQDDDGVIVPVKVLDDDARKRLAVTARVLPDERRWENVRLLSGKKVTMHTSHPWVGRRLHIEFQCRTADGSYRHPRWDRLEGE
jgi:ATP-dependent DNA ligase